MAELKDFGTVKTWYEAYKSVQEAEDKKPEDEKEDDNTSKYAQILKHRHCPAA